MNGNGRTVPCLTLPYYSMDHRALSRENSCVPVTLALLVLSWRVYAKVVDSDSIGAVQK